VTIEASIMSMKYAMITRKKINRTCCTELGLFESWLISCATASGHGVGCIYTVRVFCSDPHSIRLNGGTVGF
jgi:hypothetical protein